MAAAFRPCAAGCSSSRRASPAGPSGTTRPRTTASRGISYPHYLTTGHLYEATFENWEEPVSTLAAYVMLTVFLVQRGSAESKGPGAHEEVDDDPAAHRSDPAAPWPVRRGGWWLKLYENSLFIVFFVLFLLSMLGHALGGVAAARVTGVEAGARGALRDRDLVGVRLRRGRRVPGSRTDAGGRRCSNELVPRSQANSTWTLKRRSISASARAPKSTVPAAAGSSASRPATISSRATRSWTASDVTCTS